ncbi:MAG: LapA family protein [Halanaerobiales bacterium]
MQKNLILGLVFAIIVAIFSIQNAVPVTVSFFNFNFETSLVVVVLGAMVFGALIMGIFGSIKQIKLRKKNRNCEKEKSKLRREITELKEEIKNIKSHNIKREADQTKEKNDNDKQNK